MDTTPRSGASSATTDAKFAWRKQPRRFAPKSRKGCKTCKIRHVKCDLSWPHCQKCASTGRQCDGYDPCIIDNSVHNPNPDSPQRASRTSRRNYYHTQDQAKSHSHTSLAIPLTPLLSLPIAKPEEYNALQFFELRTLPQLNECRPSAPWVRTLMFFSHTAQCVRHAAIALGSIHQAYIYGVDFAYNNPMHGQDDGQKAKYFALYNYNLAIQNLLYSSGRTSNTLINTTITLLVCYLFICFDSISGNSAQAFKHLRSGMLLLAGTRKTIQESRTKSTFASCQELVRQITEQFRRLDTQAVTFLIDWSPQLPVEGHDYLENVSLYTSGPRNNVYFCSLDQAANALQALVVKTLTLHRWNYLYANEQEQPEGYTGMPTAREIERRNQLLGELEEWLSAFNQLLTRDLEPVCQQDQRLVQMLQLHHTLAFMFLSAYTSDAEMSYDAFLPQFETAVRLADVLSNSSNSGKEPRVQCSRRPEPSFTLEMVFIPALYLTGIKCRDPVLRRQILRILRQAPRREAVWDSLSAARIVERVMEIEEGGASAAFEQGLKAMADIPLEQRVTGIHWSPANRGPECVVTYELCSFDPEKRFISEILAL
ncbi:hypothetical protein F5Y19DRAFT_488731 [Xylariaceae sp. FL1651]|nr:hypothetical protein F5Y19DRAFT_488731 [Xylariaceae sp. FL1651]